MIEHGGLIEECERRAAQYEHLAHIEREPVGPVNLLAAIRAEAKAEMCRQFAQDLRHESRRRRELSVSLTALDGTRTRYDIEHRADGRVCIHETDCTPGGDRGVGSSELYERVEVEFGDAVSRHGGIKRGETL